MSAPDATVLLIGTADTKSDELRFLRDCLIAQQVAVQVMDVGVLAQGHCPVDIDQDEVVRHAGSTLEAVRALGDENEAMQIMAKGAASLAWALQQSGAIQGVLVLGGTMGTDLALEVAQALPLGVPKVVLSTVAHSHLIAPGRIAPDLIMVLWAGGLYGLNELCRAALSQAAGACAGAVRAVVRPRATRPLIGMTSLGKSCLSYMVRLKPALEQRGFEVVVFHSTGMGGRAFESLAAQGRFVAVLDLCLQELANHVGGSSVTSGADRLSNAGLAGVPQIVAPGAADMIDFSAWQPVPEGLSGRAVHVHNRLIASATSGPALRRQVAEAILQRLSATRGPCHLLLPLKGVQAWDLPGQPLHDPEGQRAFFEALQAGAAAATEASAGRLCVEELPAHINEEAFADRVLAIIDDWMADGTLARPFPPDQSGSQAGSSQQAEPREPS